MSYFDIILLIPLLLAAFKGFRKGFVIEVISILAFLLAIIGALKLLDVGVSFLSPFTSGDNKLIPIVAFIIIFVAILLLVSTIGRVIKKILDITVLGFLDNIAGALLGVLKWILAIGIILWILNITNLDLPNEYTANSVLYPYLIEYCPIVIEKASSLLPYFNDVIQSLKNLFDDSLYR